MVHPPALRHQSSMEDHLSRSDAEPSTFNASSMDKSGNTKTARSKRVASMSFAAGSESTKHFADMLSGHHDLPPRPPMTGANSSSSSSGMKSSFFYAPLPDDSSQDRDQAGCFTKQHSRSASLSSSSRSSSVSGAIPLSRSPSPSHIHHPSVVPFSSMLDLATAKAENITGLYFAKQMNMKLTSCLLPTPQELESSINVHAESEITIEINSPSPITNSKHAKDATEVPSLRYGPLFDCDPTDRSMSTIPPLLDSQERRKRSRSSTSGENLSGFAFPPKAHASSPCDTDSTLDPNQQSSTPAPSQATRGQHRRSQSASHFFHLSSLKHHSPAQFNLALCYEHGQGGVDQDLEKALYFYQQAADQGHTKASYNLGCICYNLGQAGKAIAWFESAGKCSIRGLQPISNVQLPGVLDCPLPRKSSGGGALLDNDLAEMLRGDHMATSGPFVPYLPAIMCLALLCRQGVQTREGGLVLRKDQSQAVELLKDLIHRAPPSMASRSSSTLSSRQWTQESVPRGSWGLETTANDKDCSSLLSTSCPSLTTCFEKRGDGAEPFSDASQRSRRSYAPTVEDGEDESGPKHSPMPNQHSPTAQRSSLSPPELGDMHETWAVTLSQHLLKTWSSFEDASSNPSCRSPSVTDKTQQRILRHHLLYITNPTHGKNLYNLGVLYDLYLQDPGVAAKCYRAAYQNSLNPTSVSNLSNQTSSVCGLVTRINSAWNLGVLHVKHKEWQLAQEWFFRAQQDIHLHEHATKREQSEKSKAVTGNGNDEKDSLSTLESTSEAFEELDLLQSSDGTIRSPRTKVNTNTARKRSLVNVVPHDQTTSSPPSDSPGRRHAREHGLMMHLSSLPTTGSSSISQQRSKSKRDKSQSRTTPSPQNRTENQEGIRTDANKISWVLRWVESNMDLNK